jgi:hypothetical protein
MCTIVREEKREELKNRGQSGVYKRVRGMKGVRGVSEVSEMREVTGCNPAFQSRVKV